jgi:hypothetical protein
MKVQNADISPLHGGHLRWLLLVLAIALAARIYIAFFSGLPWFITDSQDYVRMADAILSGHPIAYFPNGYPLLIALAKLLLPSAAVPAALIGLNVVLSVLVVWMTADIAGRISGSGFVACLSALVIAFYPNQLNFVHQMLTEVPSCFLLVLTVFLLLRQRFFFSGLSFFAVVLFRSSLLPVMLLLWGCNLLHPQGRSIRKGAVRWMGGYALGLALYAAILLCGVVKPSNNLAVNLLISISSNGQDVSASAQPFTPEESQHPLRTYLRFAESHPAEFASQRLYSLQQLWGWPGNNRTSPRSRTAKLLIAIRCPLLLLAIAAFYRRIQDFNVWILFLPIVALTLVHGAMFSTPRFTCTVEPFLVILAVLALCDDTLLRCWAPNRAQSGSTQIPPVVS